MESSNEYYLEKAPIRKAVFSLSVPMMIGMSVGTIYNVINAFFIGLMHNTNMLTAVTLGLPIFTILMAFGNMFGVGGGNFITRLIAKNKVNEAKSAAGYTFYSSMIAGVIIAVAAVVFINPIVKILGADSLSSSYTKNYALTMFLGGFAVILNFALEQMVRAEGASKESMYGMFVSTALNFIFDPLFILVFKLNVVGAAAAMLLANLGSSIYYIYYLDKKSEKLRGFMGYFKISIKNKMEIYKIGISELLMSFFLIITTLLLNNFSIGYGDSVVAGFGIALRIVQVPEFLSMGVMMGVMPLIAYNFSKKNFARLTEGIKTSVLFIVILSAIFGGIVYVFRVEVLHFFSKDPSVMKIGGYIMLAMLISSMFNGTTGLFTGIFQASGKGISSTIMAVTQGMLYIPVIILLHHFFGLDGVIWSMTITEIITFFVALILYIPFKLSL
ncbi:putative MATE family efflux protein [Clostridium acetobutylicum]|uniref:Multidrug export protein MepA n=1 Tax=Clostridium acetobutylicum (strain ATCC 824 / DSM 792 / JCM 1419 / IAM 19013 / LMG 5710 / NBRC 13948 / NRRL B-527 / VKM B-1787 / 2291 / W) TaxID=272562 RepID=Q97G84_CLOAB|nr:MULTISPECIES: MATE family efflux transporter [Clostridium]AAK80439.1 Predicted membane protein, probable cation efflux pump (MDR-type) [Clostridium acetobutylicum ATCC 824]ADZ21536.1 membane protein, probable cation efflux pump (MDR-type) [Clostridium acetobutylicum EA 2018]AEI32377.1 membane protein, cation efflux pump (MDR-type) [Clostridium acetobutylicum DSM 1731]AWV79144.1 MATE family efflux transporter [Clostridium acetobutylicum]MBC2394893.1 MATE family efflux transporter [Clostridiu